MDRPRYKRQLFFFLLAVLLPSTALVLFGVGYLTQERELTRNREEEGRASLARDTGRFLEGRLDEISLEASQKRQEGVDSLRHPGGHGVLWLGTIVGEEFHPAWSFLQRPPLVAWGRLDRDRREAERLEFRDRAVVEAAGIYLRLAGLVRNPRNQAIARQWAARSHKKAGNINASIDLARIVLETNDTFLDDDGVPIAYYAADLLLSSRAADSMRSIVLSRLSAAALTRHWTFPESTYMLRDLMRAAGDSISTAKATMLANEADFVNGIREDIGSLMRAGVVDRWLAYGDRLLKAGTPYSDGRQDLFAITTDDLALIAEDDARVLAIRSEGEQTEDALSLRPYLRDAYVTFKPSKGSTASNSRSFLILGLFLLVGLTLFGGYLLWRDVRRESRLAQLRAQFVSSVSHELRTPLTSIRMFAETMMIDEDTPIDDRRRYLGVIANESERLTRMLNNVLSASKIEQGKSSYNRVIGDLRDPVRAAIVAMRYAFEQEGVALETRLPDEPVMIMLDMDAIEQAVLNLLSNALKYGAGSPVALEIKTDKNGRSDIFVTDKGPGIDEAEISLIFNRFYRSENAQHRKVTGTGLGLSLVRHIAEAHGGSASVRSVVGDGSTFGIHLLSSS